jgi:hypothetical protein
MIRTDERCKTGFLELDLERFSEDLSAFRVAASPFMARVANVPADKNVVCEGRHDVSK